MGPFFEGMGKLGYPPFALAMCIAPYDYFGDFLRGTTGCMLDMYRCPDKLKQAIDKITPWIIEWGLAQARMFSGICKRVFMPIHKASGGFMSEEQHKEFFWPSLRKVLLALIDEGFTPVVETQGNYTDRLETIRDVPKGKVIYMIESDLFKAKEILGDTACLCGGPPAGMMEVGSPEEVKDYCKKVIDVVGKDGGFIMATAVPIITAKPENVRAVAEFTREYGVYK
jgi:uroporphyrinogen-III decarboxylase